MPVTLASIALTIRPHVNRRAWARSIFLSLFLCTANAAFAQDASFPSKPIRLIVGYPPGGSSDNVARIVAESMSKELKTPVVVMNRPGAGATIAAAQVASAPPDGHTLWLISPGTNAVSAAMYPNLPYDAVKSFAGISQIAFGPTFFLVKSSSKAKTMKDLVLAAQQEPGKLTYSHTGTGTGPHLIGEAVGLATNARFLPVPYAGAAPATLALLGDQVDFSVSDISAAPYLQNGTFKALAVTTPQRWKQFPDVPTLRESGIDFDYTLSVGIVTTAGTPPNAIRMLHDAVSNAIANDDVRRRLATLGFEAQATTPEAYDAQIAREVSRFGPIVKSAGLK